VLTGVSASGTGKNASTYTSTASGTDSNYNLTFNTGSLVIGKANATVTANSASVTYNGATQTVTGFSATGLVGGETTSVLTGVSASGTGKNASTYTSTASGTDSNYNLAFNNGNLVIGKADATVTITAINDDVGTVQGVVASGGRTDDTGVSTSGTLSATLAAGEVLRIFDAGIYLGNATVSGTTWTYTDTRNLQDNQTLSYSAQVVDAAGNQGDLSNVYSATVDVSAPTITINS
jgi:hypothetical protein